MSRHNFPAALVLAVVFVFLMVIEYFHNKSMPSTFSGTITKTSLVMKQKTGKGSVLGTNSSLKSRRKECATLTHMREDLLNDDYNSCRKILPFVGPFQYINESVNPCWIRGGNQLSCVPGMYLAGFSKCGTTDLYSRLSLHPQVQQRTQKEVHWFDYIRFLEGQDSINAYTKKFGIMAESIRSDIHQQGYSKKLIGDFSPVYVWSSLHWRCYEGNEGLDQPKYTNADIIYRLTPKAKILISLRNPVDRLYSRFLSWAGSKVHLAYTHPRPLSFHQLASRAVDLYRACFRAWAPRHCAYNGTLYTVARIRLQEGMYSIFIRDWLRVFPRNQFFFIRFEDYIDDIGNHLQAMFRFLEIDTLTDSELKSMVNKRARNKGKLYDVGPMLNETRRLLESFYRPFMAPLPDLTGLSTLVWQ